MSYVEVFVVRPNGDVEKYDEAHNSFGGAMRVWRTLKDKYKTGGGILEGFEELWESIGRMSETDQWVMASTFDNVIVPKKYIPTLIQHLTTFTCEDAYSDTLAKEIQILKKAAEDEDVQGVCFNQTSVNSDVWLVMEEDERPYNINLDTGHWFLTPEYLQTREQENHDSEGTDTGLHRR